jgi:importin subunit beta-1
MIPVVVQVLTEALTRLEQTMQPQFNSKERVDLQSLLCSLLGECIRKLEIDKLALFSDRLMQSLLQVFTHRGAAAHEDAFMTIGFLADKLQSDFNRYVQFVQPILLNSLTNVEEYQVCTTAVGLVGDMSRALGNKMAPYCDDIIRCLIDLLQSSVLNRVVKPHVISCFADIALAIEGDFERYTNLILTMLKQAGDMNVETDDEEIIDYINTLHVAIFESYSGILQVGIHTFCIMYIYVRNIY